MLPEKAKLETSQHIMIMSHLHSLIYVLVSQNKYERLEEEKLQTWITVNVQ